MSDEPEIEVRYARSDTYRIYGANGAAGGPTVNGMLFIEFYVEHTQVPDQSHIRAGKHGLVETHTPDPTEKLVLLRESQCGMLLSPETARSLARWLDSLVSSIQDVGTASEATREFSDG